MEHGTATVQIGAWLKALWVLDRLDDLNGVLAQKVSLLEQARAPVPTSGSVPRDELDQAYI
jgi:hypothetical protein